MPCPSFERLRAARAAAAPLLLLPEPGLIDEPIQHRPPGVQVEVA
jgi:hypothetical protein